MLIKIDSVDRANDIFRTITISYEEYDQQNDFSSEGVYAIQSRLDEFAVVIWESRDYKDTFILDLGDKLYPILDISGFKDNDRMLIRYDHTLYSEK